MKWLKTRTHAHGDAGPTPDCMQAAGRFVESLTRLELWMSEWGDDAARWSAFDRFVRHEVHALTNGEQVRCYHVLEDEDVLESLVPTHELVPARMSIEDSPYTGVVRLGQTIRPKATPSSDKSSAAPAWCFPILRDSEIIGLVSVGRVDMTSDADSHIWLQAAEHLIRSAWVQLCDRERLMSAWQTDAGTGVLTRSNFFRVAEGALTQGTLNDEPAVLLVVSLEGIRRLDDSGYWGQRDEVLNTVGSVLHARLRSDDVIGRFSDDRFVALLRRIDRPLAGLITTHLLEALDAALNAIVDSTGPVRARASVTGPSKRDWTLHQLLEAGLNAVRQARSDQRPIVFVTSPLETAEACHDQ